MNIEEAHHRCSKKYNKDEDIMPARDGDAIVWQWATKIAQHKQTAKMLWLNVFHNMANFNNLWLNAISMQKQWDVYLAIKITANSQS